MNNMKMLAIAGVIILVLLIGGAFLLTNKAQAPQNTDQENAPSNSGTGAQSNITNAENEETIVSVTSSGFEPSEIKVKAGTKITWINKSGGTANVDSDIHPTHLLFPFLNLGNFDNDESVSVVVEKAGTYTYHNHLNPNQKGTIIAE